MIVHLTTPTTGRRVLARSLSELRWCVGKLCELGGPALAFSVVDDHIHLVTSSDDVGRTVQRVRVGLSTRLDLGPTHVREVESRRHLQALVPYALNQPRKHGLHLHPAVYEGSMAGELLGWRLNPRFDVGRIERELPRWRREQAWEFVGFGQPPAPLHRSELVRFGPHYLKRRAEECLFSLPHSKGKVRALVGHLCGGGRPVAQALGLSPRGLRSAREREVPEAHVRALCVRVAIDRDLVGTLGLPE